ncbi:MAG: Gfo/Idh/MocA family oxidoreductase [Candidatus Promineifilaceae bacterium]|nr:Gfo/Idh/MocA family oxidoreductase [Candidatus Promineifilaceae bacterium]
MLKQTPTTRAHVNGKRSCPRLGFLGAGWIGRHRLQAIQRSGAATVAAIADPSAEARQRAAEFTPDARHLPSLDALLDHDVDGIVISTPSALHAEQSIQALQAGRAVFCQKPLARTAAETKQVLDAARMADRLLAVDLSYRHIKGIAQMRELIRQGDVGHIYAAHLTFHNAYGPDKEWYYDPALGGGGCVIDLGIHLVDLALWLLDFPRVETLHSRLFAGGRPLAALAETVEDYAVVQLDLASDTAMQMVCSWNAPAGMDAVIEVVLHGTKGGLRLANRKGSFYSFSAEHLQGTTSSLLAQTFEDWSWGGKAAVRWAQRLGEDASFDPAANHLQQVADVLDRIYGRS